MASKPDARNALDENKDDRDEMIDAFVEIYNIANDSNEQDWRSCMEKIQDITRRFV